MDGEVTQPSTVSEPQKARQYLMYSFGFKKTVILTPNYP